MSFLKGIESLHATMCSKYAMTKEQKASSTPAKPTLAKVTDRYTARGGSLVEFGEDHTGGIGPSETNKGARGSALRMIRPSRR